MQAQYDVRAKHSLSPFSHRKNIAKATNIAWASWERDKKIAKWLDFLHRRLQRAGEKKIGQSSKWDMHKLGRGSSENLVFFAKLLLFFRRNLLPCRQCRRSSALMSPFLATGYTLSLFVEIRPIHGRRRRRRCHCASGPMTMGGPLSPFDPPGQSDRRRVVKRGEFCA